MTPSRLVHRAAGELRRLFHPEDVVARRYLFVVTYGRTGSTILMKLINSMPGFDIRGENGGAVQSLIESVRQLEDSKERFGGASTDSFDHPWYGLDSLSSVELRHDIGALIRQRFLRVARGAQVGGFKEIRYFQLIPAAFEYPMEFLLSFPDARIVFNLRPAEEIVNSGWWKERDSKEVFELVERMDRWFAKSHELHPGRTYINHYSDILDFDRFSGLVAFVGGKLDRATYDKVLAKKINQTQA